MYSNDPSICQVSWPNWPSSGVFAVPTLGCVSPASPVCSCVIVRVSPSSSVSLLMMSPSVVEVLSVLFSLTL